MKESRDDFSVKPDMLWVGLGIGLFSVASCFALALYHLPVSANHNAEENGLHGEP